jgi:pimeloyl-ACP methyl ester carboxylesterase
MPTAAVNGTTLYYEAAGDGPPLIFIHGMCGNAGVWADQVARLSPRFRCIAYDRRGHTRSALGQIATRSVELHADDAAALIRELALAPCLLVGSSGGARVGVDVVRRYPDLIRGAVLSEPPLFALDPEGAAAFMDEVKPKIEKAVAMAGTRAAVDAFFEAVCPGLWRTLPDAARNRYRDNERELFGDLQMPPYKVSREDLARIHRPCVVITGSESPPALRRIVQILADTIPGCRAVELKGSGHVTYHERPAEFAAAVGSFADTLT